MHFFKHKIGDVWINRWLRLQTIYTRGAFLLLYFRQLCNFLFGGHAVGYEVFDRPI